MCAYIKVDQSKSIQTAALKNQTTLGEESKLVCEWMRHSMCNQNVVIRRKNISEAVVDEWLILQGK